MLRIHGTLEETLWLGQLVARILLESLWPDVG